MSDVAITTPTSDAVDFYLTNGVGAIEGWLGPATLREHPGLLTAYLQACATIHAAALASEGCAQLADVVDSAATEIASALAQLRDA